MTGTESPARVEIANARPQRSDRIAWRSPAGDELFFHLEVGFEADGGRVSSLGRPLEVWLTPSRRTGRSGTFTEDAAYTLAECLSLLLQHGHSIGGLYRRFKPGSLAKTVCAEAWRLAADEGADVAALDDEIVAAPAITLAGRP